MITCHLKYTIDPYQLEVFEDYGKRWIKIVNRLGGQHHGYFMPSEGANNIAYALFSFPSFADYENYRKAMFSKDDLECVEAFKLAEDTRCIISYERTFLSPVFE
ncbi:NIPSNAP family protein [Flavobacterium sp.]|uniref:NIPSNAP family protein n=1 Tax=Flavobacterium sp. TaxID=239 RepID=UPI00374DC8CF